MNPQHLLQQAEQLARGGAGRPRQTHLRRAVSTTYYALFHLLTQAGAALVYRSAALRPLLARHYEHRDMKNASRGFADGKVPRQLEAIIGTVPEELSALARTFVDLQDARHEADYDTTGDVEFTRRGVLDYVARTRQAFEAWETVRGTAAGELYLLAMLFHPLVRPG